MHNHPSRPAAASAAITLIAVALGVAGCGGGGSSSASSSQTTSSSRSNAGNAPSATTRSALQTCLKKHGITLPAGGGANGGGFPGGAPPEGGVPGGNGAPPNFGATGSRGARPPFGASGPRGAFPGGNSKFAAALRACGGRGFGGQPGGGAGGFNLNNSAQQAAITAYAACMNQHGVNLPKPNFSGKGSVFGKSVNQNTKTFTDANAACQSKLRPASAASNSSG